MGDQRPGDNLYTSSTIALDATTGQIKGHFQYHPNDSWDWDEVSPPILVDYMRNGRTIKGLIDVATRRLPLVSRAHEQRPINFVDGKPYVKQNVFTSLDPKTGRPDVDPAHKPGTGKTAELLSVALGRQELAADRVQPEDADDLHSGQRQPLLAPPSGAPVDVHAGQALHGRRPRLLRRARRRSHRRSAGVERRHRQARLDAHVPEVDRTGGRCSPPAAASCSAAAPTIGSSTRSTRSDGKLLWEFPTNSGIIGQPSSFMVDGTQYVAVQSGWGIDARSVMRG